MASGKQSGRRRARGGRETAETTSPSTGRAHHARDALLALALIGVVLVAYAPTFSAGYIRWDDVNYVEENPNLGTDGGLYNIWLRPSSYRQSVQWYPLTHTSYWIEYQLWGADPTGYHVTNVALHALNAVLVWLLLHGLRLPGAWLAALLFALHPVQVQSVAWIAERKNVLSALFYLLSALTWLRFAERRSWVAYGLSLCCFLLGLFSKTAVCTLPAILILWIWWQRPREWRRLLPATLPYFALAGTLAMATLLREQSYTKQGGFDRGLTLAHNVLIAGRALWFYVGKLLVPIHLVPLYEKWKIMPHVLWQWLYSLAVMAVPLAWFALRRQFGRGTLFALLFFALSLAPVLSFVDFGFLGHAYVTDHFLYLPCLGVLALLAAGGVQLTMALHRNARAGAAVLAGLVCVALGAQTWRQASIYESPMTFWSAVAQGNPKSHTAWSALGDAYIRADDLENAARCLDRALALKDNSRTRARLGTLYTKHERYADAQREFLAALERSWRGSIRNDEFNALMLLNAGHTCWYLKDFEQAAAYYQQALDIDPDMTAAQEWLRKAQMRVERGSSSRTQ